MNRRQMLGALAGAAVLPRVAAARGLPELRPNFIVIYTDDLGYGDVGPTGGRRIPTPNIDWMARQGLTLTDYYAPANVCTPSRAGMMTGRYPIRTGLSGVLLAKDTGSLPSSEITIAEALKPAYTSALIGKWHLGHSGTDWSPTRHGFDLFFGIPYSHDISPLRLYEDTGAELRDIPFDYHELQQQFYARAERFLEDQRGHPFFLELALSAPHLPSFSSKGFAGKSTQAGAYGDCVMEIDAIVGRLLAKLKTLGIDDRTLVIFTSDNGPWFEGSTGGLRQRKGGGAYDGGYRVPFVARWPGTVPANMRSDAIAMGIDFLPTFCALAGVPLPAGVPLDGRDITAVLIRKAASPHDQLVLFDGDDVLGIRTQRWKYIEADYYASHLLRMDIRGYPALYDMRDPTEQYSVAPAHPDIVRAMRARLAAADAQFRPLRTNPADPLREQAQKHPVWHLPEIWQD